MPLTPPLDALRQVHGELSIAHRGTGCGDVEGAGQRNGAREAAEFPLDEMEGVVGRTLSLRLFPDDDEHPRPHEHPKRRGGNTADVDDHIHRVVRFEHVDRRVPLA